MTSNQLINQSINKEIEHNLNYIIEILVLPSTSGREKRKFLPIMTTIFFFPRTWLNGWIIDMYLWMLMYINVCIEATKKSGIENPFICQNVSPNTQSPLITVPREKGMQMTEHNKSATARLHRNMFVLVLIPWCLATTMMTMLLPTNANKMIITITTDNVTVVGKSQYGGNGTVGCLVTVWLSVTSTMVHWYLFSDFLVLFSVDPKKSFHIWRQK